MFATTTICGNLGNDAEEGEVNGTATLRFSVAVNERWRDKDGNDQEHTNWYRITLWDKQAKALKPFLKKGKQVLASGRMRCTVKGDGADRREFWDLRCNELKLLGSAPKREGGAW